tara:strand:+ start:27121 stop:28209 length:1089 start_codon:yes stop_codon:yes gene_type:complete
MEVIFMRNLTKIAIFLLFLAIPFEKINASESAIPLTFSGYVVTQGTYNFGDNGGDNANNFYTFSDDESTFTPSAQLGVANDFFVIDALFGSMASDLGTGDEEFFLHQAYGILPVGQFTVMIGHMDTMLGNEVINPGDNPNITRSFLFGYSINFQNTGIRAMFVPPMLADEVYIGVSNGSDVIYDEGSDQQKILEAAAGFTVGEGSLFLAMNYGNDGTDANTIQQTYTFVYGNTVGPFDVTINGVYGKETKSDALDGKWYGYAIYLTKGITDNSSVTARYEYFEDKGDTKLGFDDLDSSFVNSSDDGKLRSFTITPQMEMGGGILRAEFRMDFANFKAFQAGDSSTVENKSQKTASLQYIVMF